MERGRLWRSYPSPTIGMAGRGSEHSIYVGRACSGVVDEVARMARQAQGKRPAEMALENPGEPLQASQ
jgi:hypothetical protein